MRMLPLLTFGIAVSLVASCNDATSPPLKPVVSGTEDTSWARLGQSCSEASPVVVLSPARRDSLAPLGAIQTIDDKFAAAARTLPGGFGGFFLAFDRIKVLMVD